MNSIHEIAPYKYLDVWVFDDSKVGLSHQPFISATDTMIDRVVKQIPNAEKGFVMRFQAVPRQYAAA